MNDVAPDSTKPANSLGVPAAIVIAGGLIALAVYYGGGQGTANRVAAVDQPAITVPPAAAPEVPPIGDIRPVADTEYVRGPANAKVTIIEYSDLECPFCKRFHPTMQQLVKEYPNDVRWVYRHFPLPQLHQQAPKESMAVECANEQGKGWEMIDKIYEVTPSNDGLDLTTLPQLASQVGVANAVTFKACLDSDKYKSKVDADVTDAAAAGGRGTPYSVLITADGQKIPISGAQPYATVKATVDKYL